MKNLFKKTFAMFFTIFSIISIGFALNNNYDCLKDFNLANALESQQTFTVTFNTINGGEIQAQEVKAGDKVKRPTNPQKEGYDFITWRYNGNVWNFDTDVVVENMTLVAYWTKKSYTITFDVNGGTQVDSQVLKYGEKIVEPTNSILEGYHVKYWMYNGYVWDFSAYTVKKDMTLTAIWEKDIYTVTFNANGGSSSSFQRVEFEGFAQKPEDPIKTGYVLVNWTYNGNVWNFETDIAKSDITLVANWTKKEFKVTFETDGGSIVDSQNVLYEEYVVKPENPTKYGYTFKNWKYGENVWYFETSIVTKEITLVATWEKNYYTVSFETNVSQSIEPQKIQFGEKISKPTGLEKTGYHIENWYYNSQIWNFETDVINGDMILIAGWQKNEYTITFDTQGGSSIINQKVLYEGHIVKPEDPILLHKELVCWKNGDEIWNFEKDIVTKNITLTAVWTDALYTIVFDSKGGSVIAEQKLIFGSFVEKPTNPTLVGYTFVEWKNGEETWNFGNDTISGNMMLTAVWQVKNFIVDFDVDGGSKISNIYVQEGKTIKKPDNPVKEGYNFVGWFYKDAEWDFSNRIVENNLTLTAVWEKIQTPAKTPNKALHITIIVISSIIIISCAVAIVFVVRKKKS